MMTILVIAASLSDCATDRVISVKPDPVSFGRDYGYDLIRSGRELAVIHCSSCHAIDANLSSPVQAAPPMGAMLGRLDADDLADSLIKGLRPDHFHMPAFEFNVVAADALVAYLESLTPASPSKDGP